MRNKKWYVMKFLKGVGLFWCAIAVDAAVSKSYHVAGVVGLVIVGAATVVYIHSLVSGLPLMPMHPINRRKKK